MVLGTFLFAHSFACWFTSGQSGWTRGLQTKRLFSMMQDFRQSSETIGLSQVSKMLRQLTGQISAHHFSSKIITSHLRLFRPDQGPHTVLKYIFFKAFFCIKSNKRSSKSLLEKLHCLYLGKLVDASWPGQTHYKLHVSDSTSPPLQSLLSPSLTVRKDVWAYADAITKFSRIDRFPFSILMKSPLLRCTQQIGLLSMYGSSRLIWWSPAALTQRPWVRIP